MPARVVTVRFDAVTGRFDDDALVSVLEGQRLLSMSEHPFVVDGTPLLALVLRYEPLSDAGRAEAARGHRPRPQDALPEPDHALFEALRVWRNGRAKVDGRPAYVLFTNAQLAEIALQRPATRAALKALDGVGEARVRHYADEVLGLVAAAAPPEVPDDSDTTDGA